jgi:hypothetical protein
MVKARGYELLPVTQLKLGVKLRGFGSTTGGWFNPKKHNRRNHYYWRVRLSRIRVTGNKAVVVGAKVRNNLVMTVCMTSAVLLFVGFIVLAVVQSRATGEIRNTLWDISQILLGLMIFIMMLPVFIGPNIVFDKDSGVVRVEILGFPTSTLCDLVNIKKIVALSTEKIYHGEYGNHKYWDKEFGVVLKDGTYIPVASGTDFAEVNYTISELSRFVGINSEEISTDRIDFTAPVVEGIVKAPSGFMEDRTITPDTPFYKKPIYQSRYDAAQVGYSNDVVNITEENDSYGIYVTPGNRFRSITGGAKYLTGCSFLYVPLMVIAIYAAVTDVRHPPVETFRDPGFLAFMILGCIIVYFTFRSIAKAMGKPISIKVDRQNLTIETAGNPPVVMELDKINDISAELSAELEAFLKIRQGNQSVSVSNSLTIATCEQVYREIHRMTNEMKKRG